MLHPEVRKLREQFLQKCQNKGMVLKTTSTFRTKEEQDSISGSRTGVKYPYSYHNWGLAFDFIQNRKGQEYETSVLNQAGPIGESLGMTWGGRWSHPHDPGHLQYGGFGTIDQLIAKYGTPKRFVESWADDAGGQKPDPSYQVGKVYTTADDLKVRTGAGKAYGQKRLEDLTADGKAHSKAGRNGLAVLVSGTRVTVKEVRKDEEGNIWLKIPSGWICAVYRGNIYVK